MKLLRYGPKGSEKPGLLDADGKIRDLSGHVADITGAELSPASLKKLAAIDPKSLPLVEGSPRYGVPVSGVSKFIAVGLNFADHAAESNLPIPEEPVLFTKAVSCLTGPNDPVMIPKGSLKTDWEVELGVVIGSRARYVDPSRGPGLRRRLRADQRRLRARLPDRARRHLGQGQGLRHLRSGRPVDGDLGRGRRPAGPRHVAGRQRQAQAGRQRPRP
jgi:hypothetical protein